MRFDYQDQVCEDQAFTGAATVSEDSWDSQDADRDLFIGRRMAFLCVPKVAQGAGSSMKIEAIAASDSALTSNVEVLGTIDGVTGAALGDEIEVPILPLLKTRRYVGIRVTLTTGTTTITLDAYLVPQDEIAKFKTFPKVVGSAV